MTVTIDPEDREQAARFLRIGYAAAPLDLHLGSTYDPANDAALDRWQAMFRAIAAAQESEKP